MNKFEKYNPPAKNLSGEDRKSALKKIYENYFERLLAYAFVITDSEDIAKDVVSDVFYNLWNTKQALAEIRELKAYLFTSVKNQAIRAISIRQATFESVHYDQQTALIERVNPENLMVGKELESFVTGVIESLPPHCQLVFRMIREDNLKYKEVAIKLGISTNTVKNHLTTALRNIRRALEDHFAEVPADNPFLRVSCTLLTASAILHFI